MKTIMVEEEGGLDGTAIDGTETGMTVHGVMTATLMVVETAGMSREIVEIGIVMTTMIVTVVVTAIANVTMLSVEIENKTETAIGLETGSEMMMVEKAVVKEKQKQKQKTMITTKNGDGHLHPGTKSLRVMTIVIGETKRTIKAEAVVVGEACSDDDRTGRGIRRNRKQTFSLVYTLV